MPIAEHIFSELSLSQKASFKTIISQEIIDGFVKISGDVNPLHVDAIYAETTEFKKPVAHGMILAAMFSRLVGTELPGKYALYLSQTLEFHHPAFAGDEVMVFGEIVQKVDALNIVKMNLEAVRVLDSCLLAKGQALVKVLK